jgi:TspO/MBR family
MQRDRVRQVINVLAVIAVIVVNILANALPLNNKNTGEISDRFDVYFVPAGYVFAIWGLIYLGLIGFAIYQALPSQRATPRLRRVGYLFALSCLANIGWLFMWHYEQFLITIVVMAALLGLLIAIYLRLDIGHTKVDLNEKLLVDLPFSIYLGWVSVATIANASDVLYYLNWNGWGIGPETWAIIMLVVAGLLGAAMSLTRTDVAYQLVLVWAFIGIAIKQSDTPVVANAAWAAAFVVGAILIITTLISSRRGFKPILAS